MAEIRGVIRAEAAATIATDLVARVVDVPHKVGQSFLAGDVLLTFDCRRYEAELRAAEAEIKGHAITVDTNRQLLRYKAAGSNELAAAEARHAQALATAEAMRVRMSQCVIAAPYDGRMVERLVDVFEMPQANAPLLRIVKNGRLEVDLFVPSQWSARLRPGLRFQFMVDETGTLHSALLLHLGAVIDPVSRTIRLTAQLIDPDPLVRPGMSGVAQLQPLEADAN